MARLPFSSNHVPQCFASRSTGKSPTRSSGEQSNSSIWVKVICIPSVSLDLHTDLDPDLYAAEEALACLHSKPFPGLHTPANIALSPYPPTNPPTPLPRALATPRLVKFLPAYYTDFNLYDLIRPYGALAAVRMRVPFAHETAMIEFWREDDARRAEDAMYRAQIDGRFIVVQNYKPWGNNGLMNDFVPGAPTPAASGYPYPANQVFTLLEPCPSESHDPDQVSASFNERGAKCRSRS